MKKMPNVLSNCLGTKSKNCLWEEIKSLGFQSMPVVTLDKNFDNAWVGYNLDRLLELKELG